MSCENKLDILSVFTETHITLSLEFLQIRRKNILESQKYFKTSCTFVWNRCFIFALIPIIIYTFQFQCIPEANLIVKVEALQWPGHPARPSHSPPRTTRISARCPTKICKNIHSEITSVRIIKAAVKRTICPLIIAAAACGGESSTAGAGVPQK